MRTRRTILLIVLALAASLSAGCGGDDATTCEPPDEPVIDPGDGGSYRPDVDPADFVTDIDHPYLPLAVGSRWVYESVGGEETERVEVVVTEDRHDVMGISAVVVRDTVSVDGEVVEDTFDWFAQDRLGNVWYLGEDSREIEGGEVVSTEGSWEAGLDGALPGIVMLAEPAVGMAYRQEYLACEAEDMAEVAAVGEAVAVPAGSYTDVLVTHDWTPLEPDVVEEKSYAPGIGLVRERKLTGDAEELVLVEHTASS
jgi:hypothetical protein